MQYTLLAQSWPYPAEMAGRPPNTPPTPLGARLAALRKTASLSQSQLALAVGIPQRTVSFYERQADHLPSDLLPKLARVLGVSIEVILGLEAVQGNKRGPKSKLERQFEAINQLPRTRQQFVSKLLDQLLTSKGD
ncbi:MAG: helix-turn-helix domain-containing protein [Methylacidiphilales bacterium]|nr:helix-turn-helix domain-containing protein [Candidatus Methylacidiphilales bacterium]